MKYILANRSTGHVLGTYPSESAAQWDLTHSVLCPEQMDLRPLTDADLPHISGYDYANQAWVMDGRYVACGHGFKNCGCYGTEHAGEPIAQSADIH